MSNHKDARAIVPEPGSKVDIRDYDPEFTDDMDKDEAKTEIESLRVRLGELQDLLYADERYGILVVLQGIDTAGKDSTVNSVFQDIGPIGCRLQSFKVPTPEEAAHDYLWRYRKVTPEKGEVVIFNRSHYESVLVERVKDIVPKKVWEKRYDDINEWEDYLVRNGTQVIKFFLMISNDEQRERLQERVDNPRKQWKFRLGDLDDRKLWNEYIEAYSDAITHCNTKVAPWHVVPSNHKWYRDVIVARAIIERLEALDLRYPPADPAVLGMKVE
ncbi:MAG: PPK2 family polyphosphate kinase [Dehalococcoidia bacterium]